MCAEQFHAVSLRFASFDIVDMSLTAVCVLWWCHLCTQDSTTAILSVWSGYRLVNRGISSLFLTSRLDWRIVCVVTTTSLDALATLVASAMNGSTSRWLSWRSACCVASLHHTWVSSAWFTSLTYLVVADSDHRRHNYSMFRLSVGLLSHGVRFLSQHVFSETPCHRIFSHRPLYPFSVNGSRHFFSVNLSPTFYCGIFSWYISRGLRIVLYTI